MSEIAIGLLRELVTYDPETGKLTWLARGPEHFAGNWNKTAEQMAKSWNTRFADTPALDAVGVYDCRAGRLCGKTAYAHRVAFALYHGHWPKEQIDHINGDRSDNRIANLRDVSHKINHRNRKRPINNSSGHMGVNLHKRIGRWQAYVNVDGKRRHLGYFDTAELAAAARSRALAATPGFHQNHGRTA